MLYVDGRLVDWVHAGMRAGNKSPVYIARKDWQGRDDIMYFRGAIDDVRMYDRALSRAEVLALYHEDGYDNHPLITAARHGWLDATTNALQSGAKINVQDADCSTALSHAADLGHIEIVEFLLANHTDVNIANGQRLTPVHLAARSGHHDVLSLLLAAKGNVTNITKDGRTPLHLAVAYGRLKVVTLLCNAGAYRNALDANGNTAAEVAKSMKWRGVAKYLRQTR